MGGGRTNIQLCHPFPCPTWMDPTPGYNETQNWAWEQGVEPLLIDSSKGFKLSRLWGTGGWWVKIPNLYPPSQSTACSQSFPLLCKQVAKALVTRVEVALTFMSASIQLSHRWAKSLLKVGEPPPLWVHSLKSHSWRFGLPPPSGVTSTEWMYLQKLGCPHLWEALLCEQAAMASEEVGRVSSLTLFLPSQQNYQKLTVPDHSAGTRVWAPQFRDGQDWTDPIWGLRSIQDILDSCPQTLGIRPHR